MNSIQYSIIVASTIYISFYFLAKKLCSRYITTTTKQFSRSLLSEVPSYSVLSLSHTLLLFCFTLRKDTSRQFSCLVFIAVSLNFIYISKTKKKTTFRHLQKQVRVIACPMNDALVAFCVSG